MDPASLFNWGVTSCICLGFLFLGLILLLWVLSPRVEGTYTERPQRRQAEHARRAASQRPRQPVAPAPPRPARPSRPPQTTAATDLSAVLAAAQQAAEAIDDIQITMPAIPSFDLQMPDIGEIVTVESPWARGAEAAPEGAGAAMESQAQTAVEEAAQRARPGPPAGLGDQVKRARRVKESARQMPSPLSAPTLADGIELILQDLIRREAAHLQGVIHVEPTPQGGVKIKVGDDFYLSVAEMPEGRARQLLQRAVRTWNELWQEQERTKKQK